MCFLHLSSRNIKAEQEFCFETSNFKFKFKFIISVRRRKKGKGKNEGKKPREDKVDIPSTYGDLATIAGKVWNINGLKKKESFNAADFWAYGCFCHQLTGNPMSEIGKGKILEKNLKMIKNAKMLNGQMWSEETQKNSQNFLIETNFYPLPSRIFLCLAILRESRNAT